MYTPVNPSFIVLKLGLRGSKLYRHVFVIEFESAMVNELSVFESLEFYCITTVRVPI